MPNKKLSELDQIITIATGDQMLINDISEAVGEKSKYVTFQQLDDRYAVFNPAITPYGEMHQQNNAIETVINTLNVWEKVLNYSVGLLNGVSFLTSTLVPAKAGVYAVNISISATCGENRPFELAVFVNGIEDPKLHADRLFEKDKSGNISITGLRSLAIDDILEIQIRNTQDTENLLVSTSNVNIIGI